MNGASSSSDLSSASYRFLRGGRRNHRRGLEPAELGHQIEPQCRERVVVVLQNRPPEHMGANVIRHAVRNVGGAERHAAGGRASVF